MTDLIITDAASIQMLKFLVEDGGDAGIRVQITPGGCSGFKYNLTITNDMESDDEIITLINGVKVFIDPFSSQYLDGTTIDFKSTLDASGFTFSNPNSTGECGCHESFSV